MSFPLIPLIGLFSYLTEFNIAASGLLAVCAVIIFILAFFISATTGYDKAWARTGF
jgi:hypothetical protein